MTKTYKELSICRICKKRYIVDKDSDVYEKKGYAKSYCKICYVKKILHKE